MYKVRCVKTKVMFPLIKEILSRKGSVRITVTGMSMYPFLRQNIDSVELSPADFEHICRGDIVLTVRNNGQYILHRVHRKERDVFYMVGDAQHQIEGPLRPHQLAAVVTAVWRREKRIQCLDLRWRVLSALWLNTLPFRAFVMKSYGYLRRIMGR